MQESSTIVTSNTELIAAFSELFSLLKPSNQRLLTRNRNFEKPQVSHKGNQIIITGWPYQEGTLEYNAIECILLSMKKLYAHGDMSGRAGIKQKRARRENLQNNDFRMCISYTYSSVEESAESPCKLIVSLWVSRTKTDFPRIVIDRIAPIDLTTAYINSLNANTEIYVDDSIQFDDKVALTRKMTEEEEATYLNNFIMSCASEIEQQIDYAYAVAVKSCQSGLKVYPDYACV